MASLNDLDSQDLLAAAVNTLGGAPRAGQQQLAGAVDTAVSTGQHLIAQAGTGTGKSLAYLMPGLKHAVSTGQPVVVSTATLALQNQLVKRDFPALADGLRTLLGRQPTIQVVKGRNNYVCVAKMAGGYGDEEDSLLAPELLGRSVLSSAQSETGEQVKKLHEWVETTDTGDRDDVPFTVSSKAWQQVAVSGRECMGAAACHLAKECFVEQARAEAREADIVVTNHAMLAIDAFEGRTILPDHNVLIVDEAHELSDRVTTAATADLSVESMRQAASRPRKCGIDSSRLATATDAVTTLLHGHTVGRLPEGVAEDLAAALELVFEESKATLKEIGSPTADDDPETAAAKSAARAAVGELRDVTSRLIENSEFDVIWAHRDFRADDSDPVALHVAPMWVGALLREKLFDERTVVLTSATLTVGGSFDAAAKATGLSGLGADGGKWRSVEVESPFDYAKQGILYIAKHLPAPKYGVDPKKSWEHLIELITAADGRTLALFASRAAAEQASAFARDQLSVPVLCQGDDALPALVKTFGDDPQTCLFGTLSLWQGVDVPGSSCSLVVLDKIPFPRPDDPMGSARSDYIQSQGGNGFMSVSAHHAGLLLAQGAGRLIRSTQDRGVVAVLDSRLATARYGSYLLDSMPPMWRTTDPQVVMGALGRLSKA